MANKSFLGPGDTPRTDEMIKKGALYAGPRAAVELCHQLERELNEALRETTVIAYQKLESDYRALREALESVKDDCENCDWKHWKGEMTETDIYHITTSALDVRARSKE